jgi:CubicO group peptidase (beta-lactamase class C family)
MKPIIKFSVVILLFVAFQSCKKDKINIKNTDDLDAFILDEMEDQNIPAISLLIFKQDEVLYEKYAGQSSIEQNTALAKDHLFLLASVSKVVTATALLQLYDNGKFNLNDKVNDYLPFMVKVPNYTTDITFKMLLTHTSGIADGSALDDQYYYGKDSPIALGHFLENYLVQGDSFYSAKENYHDFTPGTVHEYSNIGNTLIGLLVEEISGVDFNTYCKQNIFIPLGMNNTHWRLDEITGTIVQPYNYTKRKYEVIQHYTFTDYPNGGLRSTSSDLFKFLSAFVNQGQSNSYELLKSSTITAMLSPQITSIDKKVGLHLFIMNEEPELWGHDGGEQGVATIMAFSKSTKVGAIILSNQGEANLDEILVEAYELGLKL